MLAHKIDISTGVSQHAFNLAHLEVFNPFELDANCRQLDISPVQRAQDAFDFADEALAAVGHQLQSKKFKLLEYVLHSLRGQFSSIGCLRICYVFEKTAKMLVANRYDQIEGMVDIARKELKIAKSAIYGYLGRTGEVVDITTTHDSAEQAMPSKLAFC